MAKPKTSQLVDWIQFIQLYLPATLAARVSGAELAGRVLSVRAESAGWAARLRFALGETESEMRRVKPEVLRIEVGVSPGSGRRGGGES